MSRTLKGYAKMGPRGVPLLDTFTEDVTKGGNLAYVYMEITYSACGENSLSVGKRGKKMIDRHNDIVPVGITGKEFRLRKSFVPGSTLVYLDGVLMTPNTSLEQYDYEEVAPNRIKFNYVPAANTNLTVEYDI